MSPARQDFAVDLEGTMSGAAETPSAKETRRAEPEDSGVASIMATIRDRTAALDLASAYLGKALGTTYKKNMNRNFPRNMTLLYFSISNSSI